MTCKTSMLMMTFWLKGTKKTLILPTLSQSFSSFLFLYFLFWSLDQHEYETPPKQIRNPNMLLFIVLLLFTMHWSNTHCNLLTIAKSTVITKKGKNLTQRVPPSVNPGSCNKWIPFLGHHQPTIIEVLTTLWKLSWELWLQVTSVTPCTWRRGAPPALQTLCLREAPVALGVLHARQCKSNSVWMLRKNNWSNFWSPLMRRKHFRKEHTAPQTAQGRTLPPMFIESWISSYYCLVFSLPMCKLT